MSEQLILRAVDGNAFDSLETAAGYVNPQVWNKKIEDYAMQNNVIAGLGVQNTELLNKPGYILNIATGVALTAAYTSDTASVGITATNFGQVQVTPGEYCGAFQITRKEMDRAFVNLINEKASDAGYALAKVKDDTIAAGLKSGAGSTLYANGGSLPTDILSAATTDGLDTDDIANMITTMRVNNFNPSYLILHPYQEGRLLKNANFVDASKYGGREVVMNGEIGRYLGLKVFSTNACPTAGIGTAGTETGYAALLLGPRAFVHAIKRKPTIDSKYEPLDRAFTVAFVEDWGYAVLNANQIVAMITNGT